MAIRKIIGWLKIYKQIQPTACIRHELFKFRIWYPCTKICPSECEEQSGWDEWINEWSFKININHWMGLRLYEVLIA